MNNLGQKKSLVSLLTKPGRDMPATTIAILTKKELQWLVNYNGAGSKKNQTEVKEYQEKYGEYFPITNATRQAIALRVREVTSAGTIGIGSWESVAYTKGGNVYVTEKEVILKSGNMTKVVTRSAIAIPWAVQKRGIIPLGLLLSALVKYKSSKWELAFEMGALLEMQSKMLSLDLHVLTDVFNTFASVASETTLFRANLTLNKTYSGEALLNFLFSTLHEMPDSHYYFLHAKVCCQFLRYYKHNKSGKTLKARATLRDGANIIPDNCVDHFDPKEVGVDSEYMDAINSIGAIPYCLYRGGLPLQLAIPTEKTLADVIKWRAKCASFSPSAKTALGVYADSMMFGNVTSRAVRRIQRAVVLSLAAIRRDEKNEGVDIEITSAGDVPLIANSLRTHAAGRNWKLQVGSGDMKKVSPDWKPYCSLNPTGKIFVSYEPNQLHSTKIEQAQLSAFTKTSDTWKPERYDQYIVYSRLYGPYPWMKSSPDKTKMPNPAFFEFQAPAYDHHVYKFGLSDSFLGLVTTYAKLELPGFDVKYEKGYKNFTYHEKAVQLQEVMTQEEWYRIVMVDIVRRPFAWALVSTKYSPLANVIIVPKGGVLFDISDEDEWKLDIAQGSVGVDPLVEVSTGLVLFGEDNEPEVKVNEGMPRIPRLFDDTDPAWNEVDEKMTQEVGVPIRKSEVAADEVIHAILPQPSGISTGSGYAARQQRRWQEKQTEHQRAALQLTASKDALPPSSPVTVTKTDTRVSRPQQQQAKEVDDGDDESDNDGDDDEDTVEIITLND